MANGAQQPAQFENRPANKPSAAYYLLPLFLGIIGGIIGYFMLKDQDRRMAKNVLLFGVVFLFLEMVIMAAMFFYVIID